MHERREDTALGVRSHKGNLKCSKDQALRQGMLNAAKESEGSSYDLSASRQPDLPQVDFYIKMND